MEALTGENHDSVARKVRNWLNGRNAPQSRETLFQISFVLGLGEEQASRLLGMVDGMGIHYRTRRAGVRLCPAAGLSWKEAVRLKEKALEIMEERRSGADGEETVYTRQLREAFLSVKTEEDLMNFFRQNGRRLGRLHETAYRKLWSSWRF